MPVEDQTKAATEQLGVAEPSPFVALGFGISLSHGGRSAPSLLWHAFD
jgi:hypothetical protein